MYFTRILPKSICICEPCSWFGALFWTQGTKQLSHQTTWRRITGTSPVLLSAFDVLYFKNLIFTCRYLLQIHCLKIPNTRVNGLRALQQHNLDLSFIVFYLSIFKHLFNSHTHIIYMYMIVVQCMYVYMCTNACLIMSNSLPPNEL